MSQRLPAITGNQLIRLLEKDGWTCTGQNSHVLKLRKQFPDRTRITIVQPINKPIRKGTLGDILGPKQTGLGNDGLKELIDRHGLR